MARDSLGSCGLEKLLTEKAHQLNQWLTQKHDVLPLNYPPESNLQLNVFLERSPNKSANGLQTGGLWADPSR
jgi:hypothetical protein